MAVQKDTSALTSDLDEGIDLIHKMLYSTSTPEATDLVRNNEELTHNVCWM